MLANPPLVVKKNSWSFSMPVDDVEPGRHRLRTSWFEQVFLFWLLVGMVVFVILCL